MDDSANNPPKRFSSIAEYPRLRDFDPDKIRTFLKRYDEYVLEITARAQQLADPDTLADDDIRPLSLKFCVNTEELEAVICLDLIENVTSYSDLDDSKLRSYLESKCETELENITIAEINKIVEKDLSMKMSIKSARSRMELLFVAYAKILLRHGLLWIKQRNQKMAVKHILNAIRPAQLRERLESDLELAKSDLKRDFKGFMKHAMKLSEAFELVDNGPTSQKGKNKPASGNRNGSSSAEK